MEKKHKNIIKTILFVSIGILLFYLVYKDFDIKTIVAEIKNVNYWWFIPMIIMGILSHVSRSVRWQMLLNSDGSNVRFANTFMAVLNGYFANIALPRLGEVTRCAIVSKYEKQNFSKVLGTMVSERITDVLMLGAITILAFSLQSTQISQFIANNPDVGVKLQKFISLPMIIAYIVVGSIGIIFLIRLLKGKLDHLPVFKKLADFIKNFWQGILSIKKVKKPFWYFFHSFFIWAMYFFMLYVCFFAFDGFAELGIIPALIVFVAGSFGMVAPAPNGIGAYHFMIIQTLVLYGIATEKAAAFALIVHGIQTFILVIVGFASFVFLPIINKEK
ncbi:MAG: lysylphosphatidylglycerol synthase transmembrane domain-containing protein [Bacteroidales bacterium]|nr:lysylphosphatidylglycerol synthase transmembrane domain-containing protein [Bacteroidales bacterium]